MIEVLAGLLLVTLLIAVFVAVWYVALPLLLMAMMEDWERSTLRRWITRS